MKRQTKRPTTSRAHIALLATSLAAGTACAQEGAPVTPYRPSVSTPAQLPAAGQLEFELGALSARGLDPRSDRLPYLFKLAFDRDWGVLIGGEAYVRTRGEGVDAQGFGDTSLTLKRAFMVDDATAFGLELTVKAPTAKRTIGTGKSDWTVNAVYSRDVGDIHIDANLNGTRLGAPAPGAARVQTGASASFSMPLDERWSANWELSGTHNPGAPTTSQVLAAAVYMPSKRLALDIGLTRGLTPATARWSLFTGMVAPLAKL